MPRYAGGDLVDWLRQNPEPDPEQRRKILLGLLRGVARVRESVHQLTVWSFPFALPHRSML
jgi:hypothetical protein|eukprot:COSAG01_NODE_203_length_22128_cov_280.658359_14_plen_61_part_00